MVNEIAVISGKGGTGKSTLLLSMIPYFEKIVIADCDVDAPDLKILLSEEITKEEEFIGFKRPVIDYAKCRYCGLCYEKCNFDAITETIEVKKGLCEGCGVCDYVCPSGAITMVDHPIGKIYQRRTIFGSMIDARLVPGEESSGKLVSEVRKRSKEVALTEKAETILIDGSPGIACNVISTISGVSKALIVTEPTLSGIHDLKRVLSLSEMFSVEAKIIINKYDLNLDMVEEIEKYCKEQNIDIILKIPFEKKIVESISNLKIPSTCDIPFFESSEWLKFIEYIQK
ncbi:ATP-binding protein [Candidatus Izimaplasma sp. HR1]|jgi:MinD superfamily P-loop ATPase|uniref:ATP-binding protein n=1 Tax=Candidatus Izimoplasma sp. HR1 TaxID=1541959 RepID=UPI00056F722F